MFKYFAYFLAGAVSRGTPRRFAYWLALRIADLYFFLDRRGRRAVMANLRQVFAFRGEQPGRRQLRLAARRTFQNFAKYLVDFFRFSRLTETEIRELLEIEHGENLEQAKADGKGVILITGHLGNWELGGAVLASMGHRINAVALRHPSAKVNDFFQRHRRQRGVKIVPLGHAVSELINALRRQECVGLLADRDYSRHNDFVPLCGVPACLPRGPAWLAEQTGAPIVPVFVLRQDDDTFLLRVGEPLRANVGGSRKDLQRRICGVLETAIGGNPSQWFMFERVWDGHNYVGAAAATRASGSEGGRP